MKTLLNLVVVTCVALAASSSAFAKAKKPKTTLADFKGTYSGTGTLSVPGTILSGPISLVFAANKTGKTGSVNLSGSMSFGGSTVPVSAAISLSKGTLAIDNFVFNTVAQGSYPGFGGYTVGKKSINFQGSATTGGVTFPFSGSILTKTKGRTQTLTLTSVVSISGSPYVFTFTASRHLKKSEK